jgi:hypothetical protein
LVEVVSMACFLGESLIGEPLERIDPCSCAFMVGLGVGSFLGCCAEPAAPASCALSVCRSEVLWVEPDRRHARSSELLQHPLPSVNVELAVGTREVSVDLEEGVVVGRLGIGPQGAGPFTEQLDVRGEVVAFAVGGDGGRCGQPGTGVGGVIGSRAEGSSEVQRPVLVGEVGANLLPPMADQFSGSMGEVELIVGLSDGW